LDKLSALTLFIAAAEHGSFSRAAAQLGKTPSALTKAVAHLEAELGTRLFQRTTRHMALTEAGQIYLEGARKALLQLKLCAQQIEQLPNELRGLLRLAAPPSFAPAFLRAVCCRFLRDYPQVQMDVALTDGPIDLVEGGYDLVLADNCLIDQPGAIAKPLLENRLLLCASPAYLARKGDDVTLDNYQQHDWLIFRNTLINRHFWWVEQQGQCIRLEQPPPRIASDNYDFLLDCLLDGQGLQFIPQWSAAPYLQSGQLQEVMPGYWNRASNLGPWIHLLYLPHHRDTRKVKVFIEYLQAHWAQPHAPADLDYGA